LKQAVRIVHELFFFFLNIYIETSTQREAHVYQISKGCKIKEKRKQTELKNHEENVHKIEPTLYFDA